MRFLRQLDHLCLLKKQTEQMSGETCFFLNCLSMKNVIFTLILAVVAFVGCTKIETPDDLRLNQMQSEEVSRKAKETTKQDIYRVEHKRVDSDSDLLFVVNAFVNDTLKATATTRVALSREKNYYAITAEQRALTTEYTNENCTLPSEENGFNGTFTQNDGNKLFAKITYTNAKVTVDGEERDVVADKATVKVFNLDEISAPATKAVVTDNVYNKTVFEVKVENIANAEYPELETLVRYYSYEVADPVVPTTDKWDLVANEVSNGQRYSSVDHIQLYSDGSRSLIKNYSVTIPVSAKVLSNWERTAKDFTQTTSQIQETTDKVADNNGDGIYWVNYTISIANEVTLNEGNASNRWEVVEPRELVVKENGEVVYTFSELYATKVADGGNVNENGSYSCTLSFNYDNYNVDLVAPGKIVKEEEPAQPAEPVKSEGWEEKSAKDELTDNSRITSVDYVWYEDGKVVDRQHFELTSARSLECLTNWTSEQEAYSQNTNAASFTTSSDADAKGEWSFNKTTVVIKNAATLANGSKMNNEWRAYEVSNIKVTYNGKTFEFSNKDIYVSDNANVDANGVYGDKLTYIYGDNAKYITAPGMITLKETPEDPIITPSEPKVKSMVQTVAPTGDKKGYVYTMIVNWDNGFSQPVVINNGVISTFDKVENLDARVNGLSLNANGEWVLTIAEDAAENMTYITTDGKLNCQMSYTKANRIGWDEGKTVNGHSSVHTSRYNVSVDGVITDTYSNSTVGTLSL